VTDNQDARWKVWDRAEGIGVKSQRAVAQNPFRSLKSDFYHSHFHNRTPLSLRFSASTVTLSGFAGGEYFPLPASEGPAFPFLLTLDGYPTSPAIYAQGQRCSLKIQETPEV
jgi:hypothetical protein